MAKAKMGSVTTCRRNLLMNGTASAQLPIARSEIISRLTTAPVPLD